MSDDLALGLLVLRVVFGLSIAAHGAQKLFGWWNGPGIAGFSGWLASMNMRSPKAAAVMAGLSEFGGGLLLALGLLTPLGALLVVGVMFTAIATVHIKNGFFTANGGWEYNFAIIAAAVVLAITGPGAWSIDHALDLAGSDYHGWIWAVGVLVLAAIGTGLNLATRTPAKPSAPTSEDAGDGQVPA